jgi:hypothetical protein
MTKNKSPEETETKQDQDLESKKAELRIGVKKAVKRSYNIKVSRYDIRIEAKIHRLRLSPVDWWIRNYDFPTLKSKIPKLSIINFKPEKIKTKRYQAMFHLKQNGIKMNIYTDKRPDEKGPPYYITIVPSDPVTMRQFKDFLLFIDEVLPNLKLTLAEYTIDQFCRGPEDARILFDVERRNIQVSHARSMITQESKTNITAYFGKKKLKIYLRGKTPRDPNVDRVRIEYTPTRKCLMKEHRINTLTDFIGGPKFAEVFNDIFDFHRFEGSRKLPQDYEGYPAEDAHGHAGAFQLEHIAHRADKKLNLPDYIRKVKELTPLHAALKEAMEEFDRRW